MHTRLLPIVLLSAIFPQSGIAGDSPRSVHAVRVTVPPNVDGFLNDDVWTLAQPATDFVQRDPDEGKPASERTEIRVLYDDEALYIGAMMFDPRPEEIVARLTRRDNIVESDRVAIFIDSFHDHQNCYRFGVNASGVKVDVLHYDDGNKEDQSWDAVWDVHTRILPNGWSAEVKLPLSIFRYRSDVIEQEWGINFLRLITRRGERADWVYVPKNQTGMVSRFGHLAGLSDLPAPHRIELLPFVVGKQDWQPQKPNQARTRELSGNAGLDFKYGLSNNFLLDATINPDFGQVEADPSVLNLSTFETFYPEKRPFFVEGTQIIRFTTFGDDLGPGMFYSRRIGRGLSTAEVNVPTGGKIVEMPQATTILGAAKITGKTNEGLSIGVLQALTKEMRATVADSNGARSEQILEPFAHYNVIRLRQDVLGNSNIGMILTTVGREKRTPAITNGFDWNLRLPRNTHAITGFFAHTHTADALKNRIHGSAGRMNFSRIAAEHWLWSLDGRYASKRYNINDIGFFFRPDGYTGTGTLTYKEDVPSAVVRDYSATFRLTEFRNLMGISLQRELRLETRILFMSYWQMTASFTSDLGLYDDRETRGNGLYRRPASFATSTYLFSDARDNVNGKLGQRFGWDDKRKFQAATEAGVTVRPVSWMDYTLESQYQLIRNQKAWVTNSTVSGASMFAERSTDELSMTLRGTITFTRDLTLQLYGQVFLAKGHYENYRLLSGTSDFVPTTGTPNAYDFNTQSLNSNVVVRWEYLPGSTMFLVWSQARRGKSGDYFTSFGNDVGDTFQVPPSNVVLLKVSYLLSL